MQNIEFDAALCRNKGRKAFALHGISGANKHGYEHDGQRAEFQIGFQEAVHAAQTRAMEESFAYHQLSVRDNAIDRKWAEKLSKIH